MLLVCASFALTILSCEKEDCMQEALCVKMTSGSEARSNQTKSNDVAVCHNGSTIYVSENAVQSHLDHGDTLGECPTLSDGELVFRDGEIVEIKGNFTLLR